MSAITTASWYHCSVKPVSRSAGRSVVAAAAYRLGECLHDERYQTVHDYTRRSGVECTFTVAPSNAPEWAHDPQALWNAAERAETRKNSTLAREVELALPSLLEPAERERITERFAEALVERYNVAVSVAIHNPGRHGDDRNYHAHILFTTREMTPDGLGKKTRVLDDRKTGPQEIKKLRELAADIINEHLAAVNADIRVDHRSFKERGIDREPTTHLGPSANEMERRGEQTDRGDMNREAAEINREAEQKETLLAERDALDKAIESERERITSPPSDPEDALERMRDAAEPFREAIARDGSVPNIENDGLRWWQRLGIQLAEKAREFAIALAQKARYFWRSKEEDRQPKTERDHDDRGIDL
jgi:MobA/MobL family